MSNKSIELEQRLSRLELEVADLRQLCAAEQKRTVALQAQLDHLVARFGRV